MLRLGRGDMAYGTSQAGSAVIVLPVMCTSLPNSHIAGEVRLLAPCPKLDGVPKPRGKRWGSYELPRETWDH